MVLFLVFSKVSSPSEDGWTGSLLARLARGGLARLTLVLVCIFCLLARSYHSHALHLLHICYAHLPMPLHKNINVMTVLKDTIKRKICHTVFLHYHSIVFHIIMLTLLLLFPIVTRLVEESTMAT